MTTTQTPFDIALEKARAAHETSEQEDKAYHEFYEEFLDSTFYLPVAEEPDLDDENMELTPLIIEEEGEEALFFFDTEERLKEWIGDEKLYAVALTGEDLLMTFGPERLMVLNPHLEQVKEFSVEELEFLIETYFQEGEDE